ncbi:hypothetical protein SAMN04487943_11160 [Gracilibacillus orientalis]|uniref:Uncharacterized protein n=1 Tax=Gracilibacillus orientalis TaxID=334253 RepID=A0A1I4PH20_9BACI|nr:hypothetical protein [Gracilibacillus orientalis]SFM26865.1 hypothetical protein SAMN04487943_11160 [Gracilibacillus orientalis]
MSDERELDDEIKRTKQQAKRGCFAWITIIILVPILFIIYNVAMFSYEVFLKESMLVESNSPNNVNTIEVVEKGEAFSFGPSSVRIKYGSKHEDSRISNDGATLKSGNVSVDWKNDYNAIVTLYGDEQEPETIEIRFK